MHMLVVPPAQAHIPTYGRFPKPVTVPADYPFAGFEDLYLSAWKPGLDMHVTTYRPELRCRRGSVPVATVKETGRIYLHPGNDTERRISLETRRQWHLRQPEIIEPSETKGGNPSWT